jgi:hypothetical protein
VPIDSQEDQDPTLPPPGSRWGSGAQSVLPYLTKSLLARPAAAPEQPREAKVRDRAKPVERSARPPAR